MSAAARPIRLVGAAALAAALCAAPAPAQALEADWSGFATLGYARGDSAQRQQRFIDREGTLKRDSLLAGQLDLQLAPRWSATAQAKLAADTRSDSGLRAEATWAFVAWRPTDDWLLRAGRMRLPLHLQSESLDVGVARDMARMPHEVYSVSPVDESNGVAVSRSGNWGSSEWTLDTFTGRHRTALRSWFSTGLPPQLPAGADYVDVRVKVAGLALTVHDGGFTGRLVAGRTSARGADGAPQALRYPRVELAPGVGYWKVDAALPGPAIDTADAVHNHFYAAGAEWQFGAGWRVAAEAVRMRQFVTEFGLDSKSGYVALYKRVGGFTPYVSLARQRSSDSLLEWHRRLTQETLPAGVPGADVINAAQRLAADALVAYDQRSLALGTSYALSSRAKLHVEWMRTAVGRTSAHFDSTATQPGSAGLRARVATAAYSLAF